MACLSKYPGEASIRLYAFHNRCDRGIFVDNSGNQVGEPLFHITSASAEFARGEEKLDETKTEVDEIKRRQQLHKAD